jgi:hypothetical protein
LLAAALLLVAGSASAAIILDVVEHVANPTGDFDLQVNVTLVGVGGGGLGGIGFDILTDGVVTSAEGVMWSSMQYIGNFGGPGMSELWSDFGNGPTDGVFNAILTFSVSGPFSFVTLGELAPGGGSFGAPGGGSFGAHVDTVLDISDSITVHGFAIVPEPPTAVLLSLGLIGLAVRGRRR